MLVAHRKIVCKNIIVMFEKTIIQKKGDENSIRTASD